MIERERGIEQEEKHRSDEITKQKENEETKKTKILNEETKNEKHTTVENVGRVLRR